jgi:hypothetical protein
MWPKVYQDRLSEWYALRVRCHNLALESCLAAVNQWWFATPWCAYSLHWDDRDLWPDPWQLLEEHRFCSLARGLGIMYTLCLLDRADLQDATLVEVGSDNLVQVADQKYILNWAADCLVSNHDPRTNYPHRITQQQLQKRLQ